MKPAKAEFFLSAWAGFFNSPEYFVAIIEYRQCDIMETARKGDFNYAGPNVETDGFGLALWVRSIYAL